MNFSGLVSSDFMKLAHIPLGKRASNINFAATDFLTLRQSLISYIKAVYPNEYQYFVEADLGMMFIELVAYMGAVMSMKADMLANENFLSTARNRASVKKLLELIGIRMRGPLSSAADAQIIFDESPAISVGQVSKYELSPSQRVISITSPEDGGSLTYTLYKVVNGLVDQANATGDIQLNTPESDNQSDTSTVYSNLVLQEGSLVTDSGAFAATEGVKTIALTQSPVVEGSVQVHIAAPDANVSGAYSEVENVYFASGSTDRIFEIQYDSDYAATVVFGDGTVGTSPNDSASYFATYRVGGGTRGNILSNSINATVQANSGGVKTGTLTNTSQATGGANAETVDHAKQWAPLNFRRQDRLVTLNDYSVFANTFISTFGTVGKATAVTRKGYSSANVIDIYILEKASDLQLQKATPNFKTQLLTKINTKKMATDEIVIVDGLIRTLDLVTTIKIDKEEERNQEQIIAKVRDKVLSLMGVDRRSFGQPLIIPEINRQIFEIPEVRYSTIDNLKQDVLVDFNEIIQLNNLTIKISLLD